MRYPANVRLTQRNLPTVSQKGRFLSVWRMSVVLETVILLMDRHFVLATKPAPTNLYPQKWTALAWKRRTYFRLLG